MTTITQQLADALRIIDGHCQNGLNSSVYSNWSAALGNAMRVSRDALYAYDAQRAMRADRTQETPRTIAEAAVVLRKWYPDDSPAGDVAMALEDMA